MIAALALHADMRPRRNPMRALIEMYWRARQRRALAGLDARLLEDVGLTRRDAAREAEKPCWI